MKPLVVVCVVIAVGCGVDRKCRSNDDCTAPKVCLDSGVCGIECRGDDDCDLDDGCIDHHCVPVCLACTFLHADSLCEHGECTMLDCHDSWWDVNAEPGDGCEYACSITSSGVESCDYLDNDCNGTVDDPFDLMSDLDNCGECELGCLSPPHTLPTCNNGTCRYPCQEGWYELNGIIEDGCESDTCVPTDEVCDMADNDCDGDIDEGFEKDTVESCGDFCQLCDLPMATPACIDGICRVDSCDDGYIDCVEHEEGCETVCVATGEEICNGIDDDCNCLIDDTILCCPDDMVGVEGLFCIDIWEASRPDATATSMGSETSHAVSAPGVRPWQLSNDADGYAMAQAACAAASKRLCGPDEWFEACQGPDDQTYSYGDAYRPTACNGIDAHCDDPYTGCGHDDYLSGIYHFHVEPTGAYPDCVNEYGVYDINGNLWEFVDDPALVVRGGAYNCGNSELLHECTYESPAAYRSASGFRCCL